MADWFEPVKKDTNKTQSNEKWFTPSKYYDPAKVLKGVTPLYTIKQQEQEAQEKEPTLLDKVYLSSAKQKQSIGADLNVPEIGVTMKYNVEPVKNPKNISQAINYKAELDKKETEKFEKAIQKTDDFSISGKALTDLSGITDKKTYQNIINREGIYQYMTADERRIYKYLIAKKDNASARKYILDKMSDLESRKAYAVAGSNEGGFVGTVKDFSTAAKSGFESGLTNMARMGVAGNIAAGNSMGVLNKLLEPTYSEKLYEQVRANAKDKGYVYGVLLDATNSIAAQLPQIAMGAAGGSGAYLSAMALQIIGADTTEAINQGYDGMRGVVYGIFDTALEFATEKVLGGIASKLDGGETSRLVRAALNAVDSTVSNKKVANALAKTISVLSSANSEGVEEFLQAVIEPVMRNVIYGERNNLNAETFKEAVRAYIVGAVSGGIMDIPFANNTLENTRADITGKFLKENAGVESVLKLSEVVGNNSELYGEIKSSFDGGRDVSNTDLAMLYQQSAIMFEQPSEETYKNFAKRNVDALIKEAVNRQSNENSPDSESAKYMAESAKQTDTVNSVNEADNSVNGEFGTKSVFTEYSAKKYKADPIESYMFKEHGREKLSDDQLQIVMVARKLGHGVVFEDTAKTRGFKSDGYIENDGTIHIDYENTKPVQFIFKHEITHYAEGSELYKNFVETVKASKTYKKWIAQKVNGKDSAAVKSAKYRQSVIDGYAASGIELTPMQAESELIADFVGDTLFTEDGSGLESIMSDMNAKQRKSFVQYIKDFFAYIKDKLSRNKTASSDILKLEKMFNETLSAVEQKNTADEGGVKYKLREYSQHQKDNWKNSKKIVLYENDEQFKAFIKAALEDKQSNKKIYFGAVPAQLAALIKSKTGLDVENYNCSLSSYEIRKIFKDHGNNESEILRGQRAITENDILNIPLVIQSPDDISRSPKDYMGKPVINMSKNLNGKLNIAAVVSDKHLDLFVQTAFVGNKKGNLVTPIAEQAAINTPKASSDTVSNNSISKEDTTVNTSISENSENDTKTIKSLSERVSGDELLNAEDLIDVVKSVGGEVDNNGYITLYHRTTEQAKEKILSSGKMTAKEDGIFFSTKKDGQAVGYGDSVIEMRIPAEKLILDDIFDDEAHLRYSLENRNSVLNVSEYINSEKSTAKFSIPFNQSELLDKYDRGEISREEYLNQSNENWKEAVNNYGTIETGENPVNDIPVPKSVDGKQKTERFSRTVIESGKLTNRMVEDMGADILLGKFAYTPVSDESAQAAADKAVNGGFAESSWQEAVSASKLITKDKIAIGEKLLMQAIANKDTKRVLELSAELSDVLTRNGQNIQAASMFKKMTGAGKLLTVQQYINTLNKDLEAKYGENAPTVKINELIAQQIAESKPGEDIYSIYEDALQDVAAQVPATFLDKWNAWRYMAMLVNPTTHLRNIAGNGLFIPSFRMKDFISASLETAFIKDKNKRTKSIVIKKEYKEFAKKDLTSAEVKNALKSGGKFNIETKISENQRIFKNNTLEFVRVGNGNLLEAEDLIFKNIHYKHALAGFLQARGANLNNIDESLLWEARAYAVQEAMKATFNDANSISTALSAAANKNKALNIAINGILPFKKTPINVVRRGVEYSPIGLLKTVVKGSYDLKQGKITASEYIDGLGAGISGTVVFAFGALLSSLGWVTGGFGDDDEDKFKQLNGEQEYALQLFGKSYTIDWAAPACIPFFIGVETVNALREDNDDFKLSDITDAMWNSLEPVINLSMLSGVQSMIESVKYAAEDKSVISLAGNIAKSYFSQGLPTVLGKTARTLDSKRRSNYIDKNSQLSEFSQSAINTAKSKIPGLEATRPEYINAWGQAESNGNIAERIFGNFVSPGYYSDIEYSEMSKELLRLSIEVKSEDVNVFPKTAQKSFEVNGKTKYLTAEEYTKYAKAKGRYSYDYVSEFVNSSEYKKLTDEERAKVISNLYKYANAKAKTEVSDYDITKSFKTVSQWDKRGKSPVIYYIGSVLAEK